MINFNAIAWLILSVGFSTCLWADESFNFGGFNDLPEFDEYSVPVVLTATRIQQHQADVPASVTILDSDLIKQLGVQTLAELLRYVPGMMVGPDKNNNADAVHYHGGPAAFPKNLQVLVNGRSMYRSILAAVSWFEMPVALEDIRRIEIVRGPNAASYGANSYQAVINILTKHPADTYGSSVSIVTGNNGEKDVYAKQGGSIGKTDYRLSVTQKTSDGFGGQNDDRVATFIDFETHRALDSAGELETSLVFLSAEKEIANQVHDDYQSNQNEINEERIEFGSRWTLDLSSKHQLQVKAYATQYNQVQSIEVEGMPVAFLDDDLRELYKLSSANAENLVGALELALTGDFSGIPAAINAMPAEQQVYANDFVNTYTSASPVTPVSGIVHADMDEYRFDVEVQDTFIYSPQLTLVSGASIRRDAVDSYTYLGGRLHNHTGRVFGSATWQATDDLNVHLGLMTEKESTADFVYAPRVAFNYKLTPSQSFRAVYSESVRSPDLFEQQADWSFTLDNIQSEALLNGTTFYQTQQGPNNLEHQFIESYELGYYGRVPWLDFESDVRIFHEHLADVYYQSLTLSDLSTEEDIGMRFEGVEWMLNFTSWEKGRIRWNAAYVNAFSNVSGSDTEQTILRVYAQTTSTLSWLQGWPLGIFSTVSYIKADKMDQKDDDPEGRFLLERIDGRIAKDVKINGYDLEVSATWQHDLSSDPYVLNGNVYQDETRVQLGARLSF